MTAEEITRALGGRWHGRHGLARCPAHDDRQPSLSIADGRDGRLLVRCFAGCGFRDVMAALRSLGVADGAPTFVPDPAKEAERRAAEKADRERKAKLARLIWAEAAPIGGTLGERYLRRRGIGCQLPGSLRFNPECWHKATARRLPAMVAAVAKAGEIVAVHRTYLSEPGVKADVEKPKMMLGQCAGGAVPLSRGDGPLIVGEGIETSLSLLGPLHDHSPRVWAALSAPGMAALELPSTPGELVIAPDGDDPGRAAARKLADRAVAAGWRVRVMDCPAGHDWNDIEGKRAA